MSNSTLPRSGRICKPRVQGHWISVSIGLLFVLAPGVATQAQFAPIKDRSNRSAEKLPAVLTRAEYISQQKANAARTVRRELPLEKDSVTPLLKATGTKSDLSVLRALPKQKQAGSERQTKFIKDSTVSVLHSKSDLTTYLPIQTKTGEEAKLLKDPTVSAQGFPTDRSESAGESPRVNPPAGFVKDPTVSAQGFPTDR
ncbi:MAG: hypothetical protein P8N76_14480, partial [Pirellulaceae bacterium]|nr:hypothetical protein [Pirellulaceae bacterium]